MSLAPDARPPATPTPPSGSATGSLGPTLSRRRRETFERLVQAGRSTFAARGITGSSVEEICEAAGFTRGAFYSNFADKDELVVAVLRSEAERVIAAVTSADAPEFVAGGQHADPAQSAQPVQPTDTPGATQSDESDDLGAIVDAFVRRSGLDSDYFLIHTELMLYAIRESHRTSVFDDALAELERQIRRSVATALDSFDRESLIAAEDLVDALSAVFDHGVRDAQLHGDPTYGRLRAVLTAVLRTLTRPRATAD